MVTTGSSLTGLLAYIYDDKDRFLLKTRITEYDSKMREIEIAGNPGLKKGASCRVVVETMPLPFEYMGRVTATGTQPFSIALHSGKQKTFENRQYQRYRVSTVAVVESHIFNGGACALHKPLTVSLVDISQSGLRISTDSNMLSVGNQYELRLVIAEKDEHLIIEVVNCNRVSHTSIEYGCRLCAKREDVQPPPN